MTPQQEQIIRRFHQRGLILNRWLAARRVSNDDATILPRPLSPEDPASGRAGSAQQNPVLSDRSGPPAKRGHSQRCRSCRCAQDLPVAGSEAEVIWASPLAQAHPLFVLEAGLQAFEKAKARLRAEAHAGDRQPVLSRLLVAIVVLPPDHPAVLSANNPPATPTAPTEIRPGTPAPLNTPPAH